MSRRVYFISHANVVVIPDRPVPRWPLSPRGRERMHAACSQHWMASVTSIYSSQEQKARDGAEILSEHLKLPYVAVENLGENDRSSTGFLVPEEFERTADEFFANPTLSVRGWETALHAQQRVVRAVANLIDGDGTEGAIAIVSHGAVGTLLYCHLAGKPIDRQYDQPPNGGGNFFSFSAVTRVPDHHWRPIDVQPVS